MEVRHPRLPGPRHHRDRLGELPLDHMLAKRTQLQPRAADVHQAGRRRGDETHHVADDVTAQPGGCRHDQHIVDARTHAAQRHRLAPQVGEPRRIVGGQRQELVENACVGEQAKPRRRFVVLRRDESLRSRVDFVEVHARPEVCAQLRLEGRKGHAAVHETFEVRPDGLQRPLAGLRPELRRQNQQPARNSRQQGDVAPRRSRRDRPDLGRPIRHLRNIPAGLVEKIFHPAGQIDRRDAAEIPAPRGKRRGLRQRRQRRRTAEEKMPAPKHPGAAGPVRIEAKRVQTGPTEVREHLPVHGQEFGASRRRARRHGVVRAATRPEDIGLAAFHALDRRRQRLIVVERDPGAKILVAPRCDNPLLTPAAARRQSAAEFAPGFLLGRHRTVRPAQASHHARRLEGGPEGHHPLEARLRPSPA